MTPSLFILCLSLLLLHHCCFVHFALAYPTFVEELPNGNASKRQDSGLDCLQLGHTPCSSGAPRNAFGLDFNRLGRKWGKELCEKDSDGDGATNGEELGDPCCVWRKGNGLTGLRLNSISHPGDASSKTTAAKCKATTPSPTPTNDNDNDNDAVCFPGHATVQLNDGTVVPMRALKIGDVVYSSMHKTSTVVAFSHRLSDVRFQNFMSLRTSHNRTLTLTPGHYVHTRHGLKTARALCVGDVLYDDAVVVEMRKHVSGTGLYNPHTDTGDIVVDGVQTSCYTSAVAPPVAHALLTPLRWCERFVTRMGTLKRIAEMSWIRTFLNVVPKGLDEL